MIDAEKIDTSYYLEFCAKYLERSDRKKLSDEIQSIDSKLAEERLAPAERIARRNKAIMELLLQKGHVSKQGDKYKPIWEVQQNDWTKKKHTTNGWI